MAHLQDLDDYKIETTFQKNPDCVTHGKRKEAVTETWSSQSEILGYGTFGTVRLQRRIDGKNGTRAVKQLRKSQMTKQKIDYRKELFALTKFSESKFKGYQVFVEFLGWFEDEDSVFLAMEYFPSGTLDKYITEEMKENDARIISLQLLEGLKLMHKEGFTHRDLKPQNIFIVQRSPHWWVKIGDFGITKRVSNNDTALQTPTGTPSYHAPEVFHYVEYDEDEEDESDEYTNAVDVWSFGCVIYEIMALQVPFPDYPRGIRKFCKGGPFPEAPLTERTSEEGIRFIKSILVPLPSSRPSVNEVMKASWLQTESFQTSVPITSMEKIGGRIDKRWARQAEEKEKEGSRHRHSVTYESVSESDFEQDYPTHKTEIVQKPESKSNLELGSARRNKQPSAPHKQPYIVPIPSYSQVAKDRRRLRRQRDAERIRNPHGSGYTSVTESDFESGSAIHDRQPSPPRERPSRWQKTSSWRIVKDITGQKTIEQIPNPTLGGGSGVRKGLHINWK